MGLRQECFCNDGVGMQSFNSYSLSGGKKVQDGQTGRQECCTLVESPKRKICGTEWVVRSTWAWKWMEPGEVTDKAAISALWLPQWPALCLTPRKAPYTCWELIMWWLENEWWSVPCLTPGPEQTPLIPGVCLHTESRSHSNILCKYLSRWAQLIY